MRKRGLLSALAALLAGSLFLGTGIQTEAAQWFQDKTGWWYQWDDQSYPAGSWAEIGGSWYYFDNGGYMQTGWQWISNAWYYLNPSGAMAANEWIGNYYLTGSGAMAVNQWIGAYYVGGDGAWIPGYGTGWISDSNGWWYRHADGSYPADTWEMIGGSWYYFNNQGYMLDNGWHWINGNYYYMYAGGAMAANIWIDDYYLRADGSMATNQWIGNYWVGADGKWIPNMNQNDKQPKYSYEVYTLKPFETTYTGEHCMVYLKTDNPNEDDINFTNVGSSWNFDDVHYTYEDNIISFIEKVEGGYLLSINTSEAGSIPVKVYEKDLLVKEFSIEVLDFSTANEAYMKQILDEVTTPNMTPIEKMEKVSIYLINNFDYYTCFTDENGKSGGYAWLMTESGVWWENHQLNSYDSPAILCMFAEMIGGFEDIHNCYGDYPYGTADWYQWHYTCRVKYQGKDYNFQGCPFSGRLVDKNNMPYVSFASGSDIFGMRIA